MRSVKGIGVAEGRVRDALVVGLVILKTAGSDMANNGASMMGTG